MERIPVPTLVPDIEVLESHASEISENLGITVNKIYTNRFYPQAGVSEIQLKHNLIGYFTKLVDMGAGDEAIDIVKPVIFW
ncbi:MAG TPA: hypothetical protein VLE91_02430 [Candidatus Saccharimonadales bacterium]|nr:hypothetical protein [Candidatus Saccharimonadales bacterium]